MPEKIKEIETHPELNFMTDETLQRLQSEFEKVTSEADEAEKALGQTFDSAQDWHDNPAFEYQTQHVQMLYQAKGQLEQKLRDVALITPRTTTDTIDVGNTVQVLFDGETEPETFTILGKDDALTRPREWISYAAPLGKMLIGASTGNLVKLKLPNDKTTNVKILSVSEGKF